MKKIFTILMLTAISFASRSQEILVPNKNVVDKNWVNNQSYQMVWSMLRDTAKLTIGTVDTKVEVLKDKIQVITSVKMKSSPEPWIDSTIVNRADLSPIYHSSYNMQRDMVLNFNKQITGFYKDKVTGKTTSIAQEVKPGYFDSNFYPGLITWLPLKLGYKADIDVYDYNPKGKTGVVKAHVLGVTEGNYPSKKLGERKVWIVEVADEIGSGPDGRMFCHIDQLNRQLYKQRIVAGGRTMEMTLVEN